MREHVRFMRKLWEMALQHKRDYQTLGKNEGRHSI